MGEMFPSLKPAGRSPDINDSLNSTARDGAIKSAAMFSSGGQSPSGQGALQVGKRDSNCFTSCTDTGRKAAKEFLVAGP